MNPKAANTARTAPPKVISQKDKDAARQCLMLADKFLKEGDFVKARGEVGKAQKLDPSNPYAYAFLDRITYFEEQHKTKEAPKKEAEEAAQKAAEDAKRAEEEAKRKAEEDAKRRAEEEVKRKAEEEAKRKEEEETKRKAEEEARRKAQEELKRKAEQEARRQAEEEARKKEAEERQKIEAARRAQEAQRAAEAAKKQQAIPKDQPKPPVTPTKPQSIVEAARPVIADVLSSRARPGAQRQPTAPPIAELLQQVSQAAHHGTTPLKGDVEIKLDEMRRQIEMLTKALDQERKVREEMNRQQLKGAIKQLRTALEKAWINGAPKESEVAELHELAAGLGIPEDVEQTLNREVKLDMYSRAVKEVVAKQKLLRNSSRTLEWLRKVYKVTMDEYLEYESKFLMDLVADQYKGTILLVSGEDKIVADLGQRLKAMGYAVVNAGTPEIALEKIEKINPHYILCDTEFAGGSLSGIKFLHVLRANSKFNYVPFILLCQAGEVVQLRSSELRPTEGFVEKPIEMGILNTVMGEKLMAFRLYLSSL